MRRAHDLVLRRGWAAGDPIVRRLDDIPYCRTAIYVAFDVNGRARYVGSVDREPGTDLAQRVYVHRTQDRDRQRFWRAIGVVPIDDACPRATVRVLEHLVGQRLGGPGRGDRTGTLIDLSELPRYNAAADTVRMP